MPSIKLTAPDGKVITMTPPADATHQDIQAGIEDIMSQYKAKGSVATAPEGEKGATTPGEAYSKYIGGPAHDYMSIFLQRALPGMPAEVRNTMVGIMAPETLTEAGVAAGTMLAPGVKAAEIAGTGAREAASLMPLLKRLAGPMFGGALGGLAEKGDAGDAVIGGAEGLAMGAQGEALSSASKWFASSRLARRFAKEDPERIGRVVGDLVKEFPDMKTPEAFGSVVWGGLAQDKMSEMYGRELGTISNAMAKIGPAVSPMPASLVLRSKIPLVGPQGRITSPRIQELQAQKVIGGAADFDSLTQEIRDLRLKGRSPNGDAKITLQGRQARDYADILSEDVASALGTVSPGLARRFQQMDEKYAQGAEMLRLLKQPGLIDENGKLNTRLLQESFKEDRQAGLNRKFAPDDVKKLSDALFRGADATAVDIMGKAANNQGLRVHGTEGGVRTSWYTNLLDLIRQPKFAGKYELPAPYISPRTATLGTQRAEFGVNYAIERPNTLAAEED